MAKKTAKKTQSYVSNDKPCTLGRELLHANKIEETKSYGVDILPLNRTTAQIPEQQNYQKQIDERNTTIIRMWEKGNRKESDLRAVIKASFPDMFDIYGKLNEQKYRKYDAYCRALLSLPSAEQDSDRWLG